MCDGEDVMWLLIGYMYFFSIVNPVSCHVINMLLLLLLHHTMENVKEKVL